MPDSTQSPAGNAENPETLRWQKKIRPWMQFMVTGIIVFFLGISAWQIWYLQQRLEQRPQLEFEPSAAGKLSMEQQQWESLVRLEAHSIQQRYHQANMVLSSRIWMAYLGFVTGMILAIVGAAFILGKLREQPTNITAKSELWSFSIISTSPGLIMVVLGTVLMLTTILTRHEINVKDSALYIDNSGLRQNPRIETVKSAPLPPPMDAFGSAMKSNQIKQSPDSLEMK